MIGFMNAWVKNVSAITGKVTNYSTNSDAEKYIRTIYDLKNYHHTNYIYSDL